MRITSTVDGQSSENMLIEIEKAVNFLSNTMRYRNPPEDKVASFRESLTKRFAASFQNHWFPEKPLRGNAYRCVRIVNGRMDEKLAAAGADAGLTPSFLAWAFPPELSVWIDPEEVSYRYGEDGSIGVCYSLHGLEDGDTVMSSLSSSSSDSCSTSSEEDIEMTTMPSPRSSPVPSTNRLPIINPTTRREVILNFDRLNIGSSSHCVTSDLRLSPETVNAEYIRSMS